MKTIKINHLTQQAFNETIEKLNNRGNCYYVWPDTLCIVLEYSLLDDELFNHLQAGYYDKEHTINCEIQTVNSVDREKLKM